jgi:two-component system, NtrC family, response regulator HydG
MKPKLLIIDDNEELLTALRLFLKPQYDPIHTIKTPNRIPEFLSKESYDVILLDMNFTAGVATGNEGIFWLKRILEIDPQAVVIMITAYGDIELAVKALKEGATDFIHKSWDEDKILSTLVAAGQLRQSKLEIKKLKTKQQHLVDTCENSLDTCQSSSPTMVRVMELIDKVAITDANVLLLGENGTGKEVLAREIHRRSKRNNDIFVSVDLGSLSGSLFESEIFGHAKGAYTDAKDDKPGRIEIASGGTLFLDEIGNLPIDLQPKLLSVLQNREVTRLGAVQKTKVDFRLISATNMPLFNMVKERSFREDLLYRINTVQIEIPPLRNRQEDIAGLANFFLQKFRQKYLKSAHKFTNGALNKLIQHPWPGNIRELQHVIEKAIILSDNSMIVEDEIVLDKQIGKGKFYTSYNLAENEREVIKAALDACGNNMSLTAQKLGINRSTLYEKIKKYDL